MYEIVKQYLTNNQRYKNQQKKTKTGYMQHSTGTPGAKAVDFIKTWNSTSAAAEVEFIIDDTGIYQLMPIGIKTWHCGGAGNNTHVGCEICEPQDTKLLDANWSALSRNGKNNTTWAVTQLQRELVAWGYDPKGTDGNFGPGCETAVKQFQKDHGLSVDGSVGPTTLHALQKRDGSYLLYNSVKNQSYFDDVYSKAIYLCSYVLTELCVKNIDNNNVLSHAEGYRLGIASNHADVAHWWSKHNKTMDDFRADVKECREQSVEKTAYEKACTLGLFDNQKQSDKVTYEDLATVLDKLNLLNEVN